MWILLALLLAAMAAGFLFVGRALLAWTVPTAVALAWWRFTGDPSPTLFGVATGTFAVVALVTGLPPLRRALVTRHLMPLVAPLLPRMSDTERVALEAGTVWWDRDLFSGRPDWKKLLDFRPEGLTEREREFLAGPVEEICGKTTDYQAFEDGDLTDEVWTFLKEQRFFGMIIPEEYGGLGFSALAHAAVVTKLSSRSIGMAVSVMVPNSLGPAELILHYGTQEQKDHYLPRLARGEEIPCFALTEPNAGSDAASLQSTGVVCRGQWEGEEVLGLRLTWDKRYITLAPIATVLGLAFRMRDPEHLLGDREDIGITCALIPTNLDGIEIGTGHDPLGVPFHNGPTRGKDVFVPLDSIIGGPAMAGQGWRMLMQSLAAGRGIALPSMAVGAAELATRAVGAYASVRKQFGLAIGRFEGIEEPLARIGGLTYAMDAARLLTAGAIDAGEKPSVLTAIVKCYLSENMRRVVNDAMDVVGGAGICRGPRNVLAGAYTALPIAITVEGANILTRTMIVFGQGAIRCHPFAQIEMQAVEEGDLAKFDRGFFGHVGLVFTNMARAFVLGVTGNKLASWPVDGAAGPMFGSLSRMSAAFAFVADVCMGTLGGSLKFKEKLTGRLADAFSWLYIGSAALKRFVDEGQPERDLPYVRWSVQHALYEIQQALQGVLRNHPNRWIRLALRPIVFPLGARLAPPSDRLGHAVASGLLNDAEAREHLTRDIFLPPPSEPGLGLLEETLGLVVRASAVEKKVRTAVREKRLEKKPTATLVERAVAAGVISEAERRQVEEADAARDAAVAVDDFERARAEAVRPGA